ncbi:hypothetical protein ACR30L_16150 [Psychromonas sp. PT13]|uniref:hypothetical protein n=1 Tax=Psychromonas sp. PT13 TaxID=3439547 RepID=UPI003EBC5763
MEKIQGLTSYIEIVIASLALLVAVIAAVHARSSAKAAKLSARLAEETLFQSRLVLLQSYPSIELVEIVEQSGELPKLKFLILNLYDRPIKIESVKVYVFEQKRKTIRNLYEHYVHGLDMEYRIAEGVRWNPVGDLEDKHYFKKDAAKFRLVEKTEHFLVSIDEINDFKHEMFKFEIRTNISVQRFSLSTYGSNLLFEKDNNVKYRIQGI